MSEEVGVSQYPGGFFFFWNVVVPLTVLINIRRFGLRKHELGLIVALCLNPFILGLVMKSLFVSTVTLWFLILWLESVLSRWIWYRIYSVTFLKHTVLFLVAIAVPALILQIFWNPLSCVLRAFLKRGLTKDTADTVVDVIFLAGATIFLIKALLTKRVEEEECPCPKPKKRERCPCDSR